MSDTMSGKRITKSTTDRVIDGVCGGVAEYLGINSIIVRISWILLALAGGIGIVLYIAGMVLIPSSLPRVGRVPTNKGASGQTIAGTVLLGIGLIWFLKNIGVFAWHSFFSFFWSMFFPLLLLLVGLLLLLKRNGSSAQAQPDGASQSGEPSAEKPHQEMGYSSTSRRLYRSRTQRKLFGVCGGLGDYFDIDPTLVRVIFVASAFASFGIAIIAYILFAIVLPEEPFTFQQHSPAHP